MSRIPYDLVAIEANKIIKKLLGTQDLDEAGAVFKEYEDFLGACGWTNAEFDSATLERVNRGWKEETSPPLTRRTLQKYLN